MYMYNTQYLCIQDCCIKDILTNYIFSSYCDYIICLLAFRDE